MVSQPYLNLILNCLSSYCTCQNPLTAPPVEYGNALKRIMATWPGVKHHFILPVTGNINFLFLVREFHIDYNLIHQKGCITSLTRGKLHKCRFTLRNSYALVTREVTGYVYQQYAMFFVVESNMWLSVVGSKKGPKVFPIQVTFQEKPMSLVHLSPN